MIKTLFPLADSAKFKIIFDWLINLANFSIVLDSSSYGETHLTFIPFFSK